jgi:nucleotide-binding universal stress UspA family protein
MTTRKIIVGYDGSPDAATAAAWALDEAARTAAPVEFLFAFEWPTYAPAASMAPAPALWPDAELAHSAVEMLDDVAVSAARSHPTVRVAKVVVQAPAAPALIDRSTTARLVVLGGRGHGAFAGLLLGSVGVAVSAHAHCPVVVVRGTAPGPEDRSRLRVVVGVDDSDCARLALDFAFEQAARRAVDLRVLRAWIPPFSMENGPASTDEEITAAERAALRKIVTGRHDTFPTVQVSTDVVLDHPARALTTASRTAQLVVVGSRGWGAFHGMTLGSVSQHLLRHANCPVAVVRELP